MMASLQEKELQQQTMFNPWSSVIGGKSKRYFKQKHQLVIQQIDAKRQTNCCICGAPSTDHSHAPHAEDQEPASLKARRSSHIVVKFYRTENGEKSVCSRCSGIS